MCRLVGKFFIIVSLFSSCIEQTERAPLIVYEKGYPDFGISLITTPDLYVIDDTSVNLVAEFENYIEVLHYNDEYAIINEVLVPYKSNNIIYIELETGKKIEYKISNLDCLEYGGILASFCVNESKNNIYVIIGYKDKKVILYNKQDKTVQEVKKSILECNRIKHLEQSHSLDTIPSNDSNQKYKGFDYDLQDSHIITTQNNKTYVLPVGIIQKIDEN